MGKGTQVVAHEGMDTGTGIFFKCGYGDGHCSTLPIGYPLSSLLPCIIDLNDSTTTLFIIIIWV